LRVPTVDQKGRAALDYTSCAMLPLRNREGQTGHNADLDTIGAELDPRTLATPVEGWNLAVFRGAAPGPHFAELAVGTRWEIAGGDVVSSASELARLTLNIAMAHHDAASSGNRVVYGGHTIGLALAQATRAPLRSTLELEHAEPLEGGGGLVHLHSRVRADGRGGSADGPQDVLDWRFVGVMA
jgi:hypothetical protein